jgi:pyridoxine kinase
MMRCPRWTWSRLLIEASFMNILSIQSWVAYGHVGNAAAVFPLQRLGHEVWAVNTVQFSNHPGYGGFRGQVFPPDSVREVVAGIADRGLLPSCDAVLSGYLGDASIGDAVLDAVRSVKSANPKALYCCDPVIGDVGPGVYVREGIAEFMRQRAVPAADIVTPNHFELQLLAGQAVTSLDETRRALDALHALGPRIVMVTSVEATDTPSDAVDLIVSAPDGRFRVRTPKLAIKINGAGDAIAALFFVHYLTSGSVRVALSKASSSIYGLLKRTAEAASRELLLIAAQEEFVKPTRQFEAEPV